MNRWKRIGLWISILGFSLNIFLLAGCSDDSVKSYTEPPELEALQIICHDLAPAPESVALLTLQVAGYSAEGTWPTYTWEADGGSFPEGNIGISVEWIAPEATGIYTVSVTGSIEGVADTISKMIMVSNFEEINTGRKFNCAPRYLYNNLYLFGDADELGPRSPDFKGLHCYRNDGDGVSSLISDTEEGVGGGYGLSIPDDGSYVTGSFMMEYIEIMKQQRLDAWLFPLAIGTRINVTGSEYGGVQLRKDQHVDTNQNQYGTKLVWEARVVGAQPDGSEDLSNIGFWESFSSDVTYVTESHDSTWGMVGVEEGWIHRYYNNTKPMITPDENDLVYFVDSTGVFEPCLMEIDDVPLISTRKALMVNEGTGIFGQAGINISRSTIFNWNKNLDLLGFISTSKKLCFFDYRNESVQIVPGIEKAEHFAWSPDGTECAVVLEDGIWLVSAAGVVSSEPVYLKERSTDGIYGLNWSHNTEPKLAFRMVRKGKSSEDSYSAIVLCLLNDGTWINVYVSPSVNWSSAYEPSIEYTYMRVMFDEDENIYAPMPTPPWSGDPDRYVECAIFYISE